VLAPNTDGFGAAPRTGIVLKSYPPSVGCLPRITTYPTAALTWRPRRFTCILPVGLALDVVCGPRRARRLGRLLSRLALRGCPRRAKSGGLATGHSPEKGYGPPHSNGASSCRTLAGAVVPTAVARRVSDGSDRSSVSAVLNPRLTDAKEDRSRSRSQPWQHLRTAAETFLNSGVDGI